MGEVTGISWCHRSANLWWGCEEVQHEGGCKFCYARVLAVAKGKSGAWDGTRFATVGVWKDLPKWQRLAAEAGEVHRVFTGSMMDIFEKPLPALDWQGRPLGITTGDIRDRYFREVIPATPNLLHLLLTKRPGNVLKSVPPEWLDRWPDNVMTGTSVVDQKTADTLLPQLAEVPGRKFASYEPALGPVDFRGGAAYGYQWDYLTGEKWSAAHAKRSPDLALSWLIVGAESGPGRRPFEIDWLRDAADQCRDAGVPLFVKQDSAHQPGTQGRIPADLWALKQFPEVARAHA